MINPNDVADAVKDKLAANAATVGIKDAIVASEDTDTKQVRPPYCIVIPNFEEQSNAETPDTMLLDVPVEIKILAASSENRTAALSFAEAFQIATKALTLIKGIITVGANEVFLSLRKRPFEILRNSAEQAVIQVNLYYEIKAVGE